MRVAGGYDDVGLHSNVICVMRGCGDRGGRVTFRHKKMARGWLPEIIITKYATPTTKPVLHGGHVEWSQEGGQGPPNHTTIIHLSLYQHTSKYQ